MRLPLIAVIMVLLGVSAPAQPPTASVSSNRVSIDVVDHYGNPLRQAMISLGNGESAATLTNGQVVHLAPGVYHVRVTVPGFKTWDGHLRISQPSEIVTIAMKTGSIDGPERLCSVDGHIHKRSRVAITAVRIVPLYSSEILDLPVDRNGTFVAHDLECGEYIFLMLSAGGLQGSQAIRLTDENQSVDLLPKVPAGREPR